LFLIGMIAVPLISLVALWAFSAALTVPRAISDHNYSSSTAATTSPAVTTLSIDLPQERADTYSWLASGQKASKAPLLALRTAISQSLPGAKAAFQVGESQLSTDNKTRLGIFLSDLSGITALRARVDAGSLSPAAAFSAYSDILNDQFAYYASTINDRNGNNLGVPSVGALDADYSLEMAGRENALVEGTFAAGGSTLSPAVRELFISSAASRQQLLGETMNYLTGDLLAGYTSFARTALYKQYVALEGEIAGSTGPLPVTAAAYQKVSQAYMGQMAAIQEANGGRLAALGSSASSSLTTEAVLAGGVGLAAVVISVALMLWFGRRVTGDLSGLYSSVRGMAEERLPRVVERLRRGEDVDVAAESPTPPASGISEIDQIAQSFGTVQEAAVSAAVEQARLRKGVNQVFLNISMRNQSLLHRQLGLLDSMERRTAEPGELADLFRLDHLTTRMRRHAEGLIILSGSTPGRGWRDPVPVVDVLRAAVAEVEDYVRVDVLSESRDLVAGGAVNDIIHLVAELVENAAVFSPPNTRIEVRADRAGTGLVAEIEDRGLGLGEEELAEINQRLARPPEFDPASSEQLGLFVVSRLAARHQIKVSLRQSVYGGTTAIMVVPFGVIVREEDAGGLPPAAVGANDLPGDDRAATGPAAALSLAGRHRLAAAATGRRANTGLTEPAAEPDRPPAPRPLPRPPWEYTESGAEPESEPGPARPAATEPLRAGPAGPAWPVPPADPAPPTGRPPWDTDQASPWPDAFSRPPVPPAPPASPRPAASSDSHLGMPVRVPQASLAPQLRARRGQDQETAVSREPAVDERTPEATRNMMILMQQGWERGRLDNLDEPAGAPDNGTER
jgi:signal transduction histidine kinase